MNFSLPSVKKNFGKPKESKLLLSLVPALKQKRARQFTSLSLSLAAIAFFGLFAISPTLSTITDLQRQLDDNQFVNQALQKKIANITVLQQKYTNVQDSLTPLLDGIPTSPSIDVFVGQVHTLASQNNMQINRVQTFPVDVSAKTNTSPYVSFTFSIEVQGTYEDLKKYIVLLGSFNRLITLDTISINKIGNLIGTYRMTIRGSAYFKGDA